MDPCGRCVHSRYRVGRHVVEAVTVASRRNKIPGAPCAVRRGSGLCRGASGEGFPRISLRSRALCTGGQPVSPGGGLECSAFLCMVCFLFLVFASVRVSPLALFFVVALEVQLALPGEVPQPWCRHRISVYFRWDGALLAVFKALDGDGSSKLGGSAPVSVHHHCEEEGEVRAGDADGAEEDVLCDHCCCILFYRGLCKE